MIADDLKETQKQFITRRRQETGVSPVKLHHMPMWMRKRIKHTFGVTSYSSAFAVQDRIRRLAGDMFDHWGSTVIDGAKCFVMEPYSSIDKVLGRAHALAETMGLHLLVSKTSWWYPDSTIRIAFSESPLKDDDTPRRLIAYTIEDLELFKIADNERTKREILEGRWLFTFREYNYSIEWYRCDTPQKILDWIDHLSDKTWVTVWHLKKFIAAAVRKHGLKVHGLA